MTGKLFNNAQMCQMSALGQKKERHFMKRYEHRKYKPDCKDPLGANKQVSSAPNVILHCVLTLVLNYFTHIRTSKEPGRFFKTKHRTVILQVIK